MDKVLTDTYLPKDIMNNNNTEVIIVGEARVSKEPVVGALMSSGWHSKVKEDEALKMRDKRASLYSNEFSLCDCVMCRSGDE